MLSRSYVIGRESHIFIFVEALLLGRCLVALTFYLMKLMPGVA